MLRAVRDTRKDSKASDLKDRALYMVLRPLKEGIFPASAVCFGRPGVDIA